MDRRPFGRKPARVLTATALGTFAMTTLLQIAPAYAQQPRATASSQAAAPPAARPPIPNRANEALPPWLRVRAEFRERIEGFQSLNFIDERDDAYALSRLRLNATVTPKPWMNFQVQAQDARVADKSVGPTGVPFHGPFDLRQAFGEFGSAKSTVVVRGGRQELAYGEQRLVGHVSWTNTARTFDGARVTYKAPKLTVDGFAASVVRILDNEFDKSGNGNLFYGAYASAPALVPRGSFEPYFFTKHDRDQRTEANTLEDLTVTTVGVRWVGRLPLGLDYGTEMAFQSGSLGGGDVSAWAGHWQLRESLPGRGAVKLTGEYNSASGDENPTDGKRGTFDQLYPTPHDKYGLADQVGWRNIHHVRGGIEAAPWRKWQLTSAYHSWWLDEKRDGLYNAGGTLIARVPAGANSAHVGQEIDAQASRALTPQLSVAGGYAHIFPGGFLKQATPGASYSYPYVMATYVFLADK